MAKTGIARIDNLFAGAPGVAPIGPGDPDREAVGAIQDLLISYGNHLLPDVRQPSYGDYGSMTANAVQKFRSSVGLPVSQAVDDECLRAIANGKPSEPSASRSYIALTLNIPVSAITYLVTLTGLWEAGAKFARLNLNTDRAGLSFGLIQWAQAPRRLNEILAAFRAADAARFNRTFGEEATAAALLAHTAKPNGGVDTSGQTTDSNFNLVADPWIGRFQAAGRDLVFQRVQVTLATADAQAAYNQIKNQTPLIRSQRGVGFLLDMANQHGTAGAANIYAAVSEPGLTESSLLQRMRDESVRRVGAKYGPNSAEAQSTASRRDWFRTTPALSNSDFADSQSSMSLST